MVIEERVPSKATVSRPEPLIEVPDFLLPSRIDQFTDWLRSLSPVTVAENYREPPFSRVFPPVSDLTVISVMVLAGVLSPLSVESFPLGQAVRKIPKDTKPKIHLLLI
jgi:hypothetical protein